MTEFLILPEESDELAIDEFLLKFDKFLNEIFPDWNDSFSINVTKIDEEFVKKYAEGFYELREIGTVGLSKKYVGRYYISLYYDIPFWVKEGVKAMTKSQSIEIKEKKREGDW